MAWLGFVLRWWLIISLVSLVAIVAIAAWERFVMTRLRFDRWRVKVSRDPTSRTRFIREVMRVRRIRVEPGRDSGPPGSRRAADRRDDRRSHDVDHARIGLRRPPACAAAIGPSSSGPTGPGPGRPPMRRGGAGSGRPGAIRSPGSRRTRRGGAVPLGIRRATWVCSGPGLLTWPRRARCGEGVLEAMADIVLINPRFEVSYWGMEHALPFLGKRANLPVACLPLLAALTPGEHTVTLIDENVEAIDFDALRRADIVGVTGHERAAVPDEGDPDRAEARGAASRSSAGRWSPSRRTTSTAWPT